MALPVIPNIALLRNHQLCILAKNKPTGFTHAALQWVLLTDSGLDSDATLRDYTDLDKILKRNAAGTGSQVAECSFTGYSRLTVATSDISILVDNGAENVYLDILTNPFWDPGTSEHVGAIVLVFNPDTTAGSNDVNCVPMFIDACDEVTGTGGSTTRLTYVVASGGFVSGLEG